MQTSQPETENSDYNFASVFAPRREGKNQNEKTFGLKPEEIFQAIYRLVLAWLLHMQMCITWSLCSVEMLNDSLFDGLPFPPDQRRRC